MPSDQTSLTLVPAAARDDTTVTAFRYSNYDIPFWVRENTRAGRWNCPGNGSTQYWALCPEAAWAELIRYEGLTTEDELDEVRMALWVCRIPKLGLLDLRDHANRRHWRLDDDDLVADDAAKTQVAGVTLRQQGIPGIVSPSAALTGHANITLFGPRRAVDWHTRPALASALPTTRAAIGRPPPGLIPHVNRPGPAHPSQSLLF